MSSNMERQSDFANKLLALQDEAQQKLSPVGWFLLISAICSLGEPSKSVYPSLSHSHNKIEGLGETYRQSLKSLSENERNTIQWLWARFVGSLSYGKPTASDLRD